MDAGTLIREYLLLGLRFDRIEEGYVDSFTGDPGAASAGRRTNPRPTPPTWPARPSGCSPRCRGPTASIAAARRLRRAPTCGRWPVRAGSSPGQDVGFVDEVRGLFRRAHRQGRPGPLPARRTASSTRRWAAADRSPSGCRPTARPRRSRRSGSRSASTRSPARCATGCAPNTRCPTPRPSTTRSSPTSRGRGSTTTSATTAPPSPSTPTSSSRCPTCRGWSRTSPIPATTPSTAARKPGWSRARARPSRRIFLVNTPQCLMAEGLADLALLRRDRPELGRLGRARSTPTSGCGSTANAREAVSEAAAALADVRQDAALMLHDEHRDVDDVVGVPASAGCWSTTSGPGRCCGSCPRRCGGPTPAPTSRVTGCCAAGWTTGPAASASTERFGRLLDEPLIPSALRLPRQR